MKIFIFFNFLSFGKSYRRRTIYAIEARVQEIEYDAISGMANRNSLEKIGPFVKSLFRAFTDVSFIFLFLYILAMLVSDSLILGAVISLSFFSARILDVPRRIKQTIQEAG